MINTRVASWALGLSTAISFVVCVAYGLIVPESLHSRAFLEQVLPAFKWLTWGVLAWAWPRVSSTASTPDWSSVRSTMRSIGVGVGRPIAASETTAGKCARDACSSWGSAFEGRDTRERLARHPLQEGSAGGGHEGEVVRHARPVER